VGAKTPWMEEKRMKITVFVNNSRKREVTITSLIDSQCLEALCERYGAIAYAKASKIYGAMMDIGSDMAQFRVGQRRIRISV
jgi:hypothetical protein